MADEPNKPSLTSAEETFASLAGQTVKLYVEGFPNPLTLTVHKTAIHEPLPDDHPVYALIGKVASEWAIYEHVLDGMIWTLAELGGRIGASITAQIMGAGPRLITVRSLAQELGILEKIESDLNSIERATYGPQEGRNRAVHDPWAWERLAGVPEQHRSKPRKEPEAFGYVPVEAEELTTFVSDIRKLRTKAQLLQASVTVIIKERRKQLDAWRDTRLPQSQPDPGQ